MHQISPFRARKGDAGFTPTQIPASKGDKGCRQPGHLIDRAWLRCPWAVAGLGRATNGRTTLQTSSNRSDLKALPRTSVTNVVNLSPKTTIFNEKAAGLTTFVTTDQKSTRKTPPIDDVCNNTQENGQKSQRARPLRCHGRRRDRRARAGFEPTRRTRQQRPSPTGVEGTGGTGGPGCGARGRWRGLAGLRDDAPSEARGAGDSRAGRRPRAHQVARPHSRARRRPEHQRSKTQPRHNKTARPHGAGRFSQYQRLIAGQR